METKRYNKSHYFSITNESEKGEEFHCFAISTQALIKSVSDLSEGHGQCILNV